MKRIIWILMATTFSTVAFAQTGTISGKVTDANDGFEIPGANVYLKENLKGAGTDLDGNFTITGITPGTYTIVCSFISYTDQVLEGIVVSEDETTILDISMGVQVTLIQGAEIVVRQNRASDAAMDVMKRKAPAAMDGLSSASIQRNGDKNVAAAAKRVTGVSIEGGKYVYVRGLSDRYSKTTLNRAEIPGLDPNRNSVQLDLFPSSLIQNLTIAKAFTPDLPGSFTGGLVNIETKDFPDEFEQRISVSAGYNTQATFNSDFLTYEGGSTDWLGMDNGSRAIPEELQNEEVAELGTGNDALLADQTRSFSKVWDVQRSAAMPSASLTYSLGNRLDFGSRNRSLGFNAAMTYNQNSRFYSNGTTSRYLLTGDYNTSNLLNVQSVMSDAAGEENVLWGGLFNTGLRLNKHNSVGLVLLHNQSGTSTARYQKGRVPSIDPDDIKEQRSLRYLERSLSVAQLKGLHRTEDAIVLDWIISAAYSTQDTPDLKTFDNDYTRNSSGAIVYSIDEAAYPAPNRYFREMSEVNLDAKVNLSIPLKFIGVDTTSSTLKIGGARVTKNRDFSERRFEFGQVNMPFDGNIQAFFSDENMNVGSSSYLFVEDLTDTRNTYEAHEEVVSGYAMVDFQPVNKLRVVAGARAENAFSQATSLKYFEQTDEVERAKYRGTLDNLDVLPSVNLTWSPNDSCNVRLAYTRTLARPTFRELAPFASFDFETRYVKIGNPELQRTLVDNIDLRYEVYPNLGEILSVSAFYKKFENPIELVINPLAANVELSWQNQSRAQVYGAEFEFRKGLAFLGEKLEDLAAAVNFTYVYSQTEVNEAELAQIRAQDPDHPDTRIMFGQSPYIANAILQYDQKNDTTGWSINLGYNVSGPKLALVIGVGTPNVFDMPRHDLNLSITRKLSANAQLRLNARNLLDASSRMVYEFKGTEYVFQSMQYGRTFSLSYSLQF